MIEFSQQNLNQQNKNQGQHTQQPQQPLNLSQNYESFDSQNQQLPDQLQKDKNGFLFYQSHKQRSIDIPQMPTNLPKLYQIYLHNQARKKSLKQAISSLISKQLKIYRIKYDKQTSAIEPYIDIEENSQQFEQSQKNYLQRKKTLQNLKLDYGKLKLRQIQSIIHNKQEMKNILLRYNQDHNYILSVQVYGKTVRILTRQLYRVNRLNTSTNKNIKNLSFGKNKKPINLRNKSENQKIGSQLQDIERRESTQSKSVVNSQDENLALRFTLRSFTYYLVEQEADGKLIQEISFKPLSRTLQMPLLFDNENDNQLIEYTGFTYSIKTQLLILHDNYSFYIVSPLSTIYVGTSKIIFCQASPTENLLYVGTADGLLRLYQLDKQLKKCWIIKIFGCFSGEQNVYVTHFSLTKNPKSVIFVQNNKKIYQMNLTTYTSYFLHEFTEADGNIEKITARTLEFKEKVYTDYYTPSGLKGKITLKANNELIKIKKQGNNIIGLVSQENSENFVVIDQGFGNIKILVLKI